MSSAYILRLRCPDRPGIVAAVSARLLEFGGNITEAQQYNDPESGQFFMRVAFDTHQPGFEAETLRRQIAAVGTSECTVRPAARRMKTLLLVSHLDHCLADLLYRTRIGELAMDIVGIVSNHPRSALSLENLGGAPFHHLPVTRETKPRQESELRTLIERSGAELVVLARYMQILSNDMATFLAGRCINIHHGFLPSFKGAQPYHQAHRHGVKIIGATAHYVTADLDEGPIIEQDVVRVSHSDTPESLIRKGREVECRVLARAVMHHVEDRVLQNGPRTVVFTQ